MQHDPVLPVVGQRGAADVPAGRTEIDRTHRVGILFPGSLRYLAPCLDLVQRPGVQPCSPLRSGDVPLRIDREVGIAFPRQQFHRFRQLHHQSVLPRIDRLGHRDCVLGLDLSVRPDVVDDSSPVAAEVGQLGLDLDPSVGLSAMAEIRRVEYRTRVTLFRIQFVLVGLVRYVGFVAVVGVHRHEAEGRTLQQQGRGVDGRPGHQPGRLAENQRVAVSVVACARDGQRVGCLVRLPGNRKMVRRDRYAVSREELFGADISLRPRYTQVNILSGWRRNQNPPPAARRNPRDDRTQRASGRSRLDPHAVEPDEVVLVFDRQLDSLGRPPLFHDAERGVGPFHGCVFRFRTPPAVDRPPRPVADDPTVGQMEGVVDAAPQRSAEAARMAIDGVVKFDQRPAERRPDPRIGRQLGAVVAAQVGIFAEEHRPRHGVAG